MIAAEADLIRKTTQACIDADRVTIQLGRIHAPKERLALAEENSLQAGTLLNIVILRYLQSLNRIVSAG